MENSYQELSDDYDDLLYQNGVIQDYHKELKENYQELERANNELKNDYNSLLAENEKLKKKLGSLNEAAIIIVRAVDELSKVNKPLVEAFKPE